MEENGMRVIITGGTGLIGKALAKSLALDRHEVIILSRSPDKHQAGLPSGVRAEQWDAVSARGWGKLADGAAAIVNLAGENLGAGRWSEARKKEIQESRLNAGKAVTEAILAAGVKPGVVIQASAVGYYGVRGDEPVTEADHAGNDFQARVCVDWEESTAEVEAAGVRRVIMRTGVVLDAREGALPRMLLPYRFFAGGPLGSGKQWFSWIHLDDDIAAMRFLIDSPQAAGVYNLSAPNPLTNAEFGRAIGSALGRPSFIPAPGFAIRMVFGEMATIILDGQRVIPERLLASGYKFKYTHAVPALKSILQK
jgi:uncharacterized protein